MFSIQIKRNAQKVLAKIPERHQKNIINAIYQLADLPLPNGCKKLTGKEAWRIRIGDYRVIYEIENKQLMILVIEIGHRKEIYKN
jgi:mRNA interferase RelE/StbE